MYIYTYIYIYIYIYSEGGPTLMVIPPAYIRRQEDNILLRVITMWRGIDVTSGYGCGQNIVDLEVLS